MSASCGKCIAIGEIAAAARHAERDAVGFVVGGIDQRRAEIGGRLLGKMRRQHDAQTERGRRGSA